MTLHFSLMFAAVLAQRLAELRLAARNAERIRRMGGYEAARNTYPAIVLLHAAFFGSWALEFWIARPEPGALLPAGAVAFAVLQALRYWCIVSLGPFWNTRVFVVPGMKPVRRGPYRYMKHPNYAVVTLELLVLPLMFGCLATAAVFPLLNVFVLQGRIAAEEAAIRTAASAKAAEDGGVRTEPAGEGA